MPPAIPILVAAGTAAIGTAAAAAVGTAITAGIGAVVLVSTALTLVSALRGILTSSREQGQTVPAVGADQPLRHVVGRTRNSGQLIGRHSSGDDNEWLFEARVMSFGPIIWIVGIYINGDLVTLETSEDETNEGFEVRTNPYNDEICYITTGRGLPSEPVDGMGRTFGDFQLTHRHQPFAYINSRYKTDDAWENNLPRLTALIDGRYIFDPRNTNHDINNEMSWGFSDNPALIAAWYVMQPWTFNAGFDDIDWDAIRVAANICDEVVPSPEGNENRYRMGGVFFENGDKNQMLLSIVRAMGGDYLQPKKTGKWVFYAGAYAEPVLVIQPGDIIYCDEYSPYAEKNTRINTIHGQYQSARDNYQSVGYPTVNNDAALEREGEAIESTLDLEYVQSEFQAQRIAAIQVAATNYQRRWRGRLKIIGYALVPGQRVILNDTNYEPEMVGITMRVVRTEYDGIEVTVTLREDSPEIYEAPVLNTATSTTPFNNLPTGFTGGLPGGTER